MSDPEKRPEAPLVSVVIPNHNGRGVLARCLDSLRAQAFHDFEVIVVDNGSSDGSVAMVEEDYPEVTLVRSPVNLGFGAANNLGFERARGEYYALLNNDAVADPGWLEQLVSAARRAAPTCGMWACKVLLAGEDAIIDTVGHLLYGDGLNVGRGRGERDVGQYEAEEEVLFPSGCAALLSSRMIQEIGGFDPDFFA